MNSFERILLAATRVFSYVSAVALILMMVVMCAEVVSRLFQRSFTGAYDIIGFLAAPMIALGIARTQAEKSQVVIDVFDFLFGKRAKAILDAIHWFLCLILFAPITWQLCVHATELWGRGEVSPTLWWPMYPFVFVIALGFIVLCVVLAVDFLRSAAHSVRKG